eukprot:1279022-Amphidinium_carterae.1
MPTRRHLGVPMRWHPGPRELVYLHRVIRAVPETGCMEIESDQRHVGMIVRELGLEPGSRGKDVPSIKMTIAELNQVAATAAL